MSVTFHGVLKGQTLVILDRAAPLPDGTPVAVMPLTGAAGNPAALLAAMSAAPHLTPDDIAELDKVIAEGQRPAPRLDPFADNAPESGTV